MNNVFKTMMKATQPEYNRFIRRAIIRDMGSSAFPLYYSVLEPDDTKRYKEYIQQYKCSSDYMLSPRIMYPFTEWKSIQEGNLFMTCQQTSMELSNEKRK